jgi:hypothetical protein
LERLADGWFLGVWNGGFRKFLGWG